VDSGNSPSHPEVDDLVLDPDFVNERNNLYASLDNLQAKKKKDVSRGVQVV
jgi:hypothetical protein